MIKYSKKRRIKKSSLEEATKEWKRKNKKEKLGAQATEEEKEEVRPTTTTRSQGRDLVVTRSYNQENKSKV